jgi:hypothetical protein
VCRKLRSFDPVTESLNVGDDLAVFFFLKTFRADQQYSRRGPRGQGLCDFALDKGAINHSDLVAAVRQESQEMHEVLAAYLFKAFEFGKRINVVVNAQVEIRPFLVTANHKRRRLLSTLIAASGLAGAQRGDEPARKREYGIPFISRGRVLNYASADQHIPGDRDIVTGEMPTPAYAGFSCMRGDRALRVHHMNLPMVAPRVSGGYREHNVPSGLSLFQQSQALGAVKRIDQGLCRDRTNARSDVRSERAHSEKTSRNGNSELSGVPIASDDRPGHANHPRAALPKSNCLSVWLKPPQ